MSDLKTFDNKHGTLTMEREGDIIVARFSGAVNGSMLRFFFEHLVLLAEAKATSPWAFLNASESAFAATAEAEALLVKAGIKGYQLGCVQAAYVLQSPVAVAQTKKIRATIGITQPLEEVLFATEPQAHDYLISYLSNYPLA